MRELRRIVDDKSQGRTEFYDPFVIIIVVEEQAGRKDIWVEK